MPRWIGIVVVLVLGAVVAPHIAQAQQARTNILLMSLDNVGYGDLACYGNAANRTPCLDRLALQGIRCTAFYVAASSCSPSRGALLTGRHPLRNGLAHQLSKDENRKGIGLPHRERLIPGFLKTVNYTTGCFGKWNIGFAPGSRPTERGFDDFLGFRSGNIHYYKHLYNGEADLFRGIEPVDRRGEYSTDLFADAAIEFFRDHREDPWFVYLPFNAVHFVSAANVEPGEEPEWQAPAKFLEQYGYPPDERDPAKRFQAVLTALDDAIGRVLQSLDDLQLSENTLVICVSDNGAFMLPGRGLEVQSNAPFRSGGTTAYEGGVRVPAIFRWPGKLPAGQLCSETLSQLDILPLCLAAAGVPLPGDRVFDGSDPLPVLMGKGHSRHERLAFSYGGSDGLRLGDLKIVRPKPSAAWELYDLAADPAETTDLASRRPADLERLTQSFAAWKEEVQNDPSPPARTSPRSAR